MVVQLQKVLYKWYRHPWPKYITGLYCTLHALRMQYNLVIIKRESALFLCERLSLDLINYAQLSSAIRAPVDPVYIALQLEPLP